MGAKPNSKTILRAFNQTKNVLVAGQVRPATTFLTRLKGLLGTRQLARDEGLYIKPCGAIHMIGMSYAIDAIFFDDQLSVVGTESNIPPGKLLVQFKGATSVLELKAGTIEDCKTQVGDKFLVEAQK